MEKSAILDGPGIRQDRAVQRCQIKVLMLRLRLMRRGAIPASGKYAGEHFGPRLRNRLPSVLDSRVPRSYHHNLGEFTIQALCPAAVK